jgi:hypothetical protein
MCGLGLAVKTKIIGSKEIFVGKFRAICIFTLIVFVGVGGHDFWDELPD